MKQKYCMNCKYFVPDPVPVSPYVGYCHLEPTEVRKGPVDWCSHHKLDKVKESKE